MNKHMVRSAQWEQGQVKVTAVLNIEQMWGGVIAPMRNVDGGSFFYKPVQKEGIVFEPG